MEPYRFIMGTINFVIIPIIVMPVSNVTAGSARDDKIVVLLVNSFSKKTLSCIKTSLVFPVLSPIWIHFEIYCGKILCILKDCDSEIPLLMSLIISSICLFMCMLCNIFLVSFRERSIVRLLPDKVSIAKQKFTSSKYRTIFPIKGIFRIILSIVSEILEFDFLNIRTDIAIKITHIIAANNMKMSFSKDCMFA